MGQLVSDEVKAVDVERIGRIFTKLIEPCKHNAELVNGKAQKLPFLYDQHHTLTLNPSLFHFHLSM